MLRKHDEGLIKFLLVLRDLLIRRDFDLLAVNIHLSCNDSRAPDAYEILTRLQPARDFHNLLLSHAEHQKISPRINENGTPYTIFPPVIVGKPPEACLNASQHDAHIAESLPDPIRINSGGPVRAKPCPASGRIVITGAWSLIGRIVGNHGVKVPGSNPEEETWSAEPLEVLSGAPIGLSDDGRPETRSFKRSPDEGCTVGWVIHVCIACHQDYVDIVPAADQQVFFGNGKKGHKSE